MKLKRFVSERHGKRTSFAQWWRNCAARRYADTQRKVHRYSNGPVWTVYSRELNKTRSNKIEKKNQKNKMKYDHFIRSFLSFSPFYDSPLYTMLHEKPFRTEVYLKTMKRPRSKCEKKNWKGLARDEGARANGYLSHPAKDENHCNYFSKANGRA